MFTGIVETMGKVSGLQQEGSNLHLTITSPLAAQLKIDQSLAHNGVCLTVVACNEQQYTVTAIQETLLRTNLGSLKVGDFVNLERALQYNGRIDGHLVQGHVDLTGICTDIQAVDGSWNIFFEYPANSNYLLVDKGSIAINGVSLTVVNPDINCFSVSIIPYTFQHTTFHSLHIGDAVNLEFDILGKYMARYAQVYKPTNS